MGKFRPETVPALFGIEAAGTVPIAAKPPGGTAAIRFTGDAGTAVGVLAFRLGFLSHAGNGTAAATGIAAFGTVGDTR